MRNWSCVIFFSNVKELLSMLVYIISYVIFHVEFESAIRLTLFCHFTENSISQKLDLRLSWNFAKIFPKIPFFKGKMEEKNLHVIEIESFTL